MAEVFGGKKVLTAGITSLASICLQVLAAAMGGTAALSLLIPTAAKLGGHTGYPYYLVFLRVLMGLCEAATFPCITSMLARWAPEQERATMTTFIMAGSQVYEEKFKKTENDLYPRLELLLAFLYLAS